jgi:hypothetical protein
VCKALLDVQGWQSEFEGIVIMLKSLPMCLWRKQGSKMDILQCDTRVRTVVLRFFFSALIIQNRSSLVEAGETKAPYTDSSFLLWGPPKAPPRDPRKKF